MQDKFNYNFESHQSIQNPNDTTTYSLTEMSLQSAHKINLSATSQFNELNFGLYVDEIEDMSGALSPEQLNEFDMSQFDYLLDDFSDTYNANIIPEQKINNENSVLLNSNQQTQNLAMQRSSIELVPIIQVGCVCKTVAIQNIENYFAKQLGYEPVPLWSRQQQRPSTRKLVKANGSKQGEILEFDQWRKNLTDLGFDTEVVDFTYNFSLFHQTIISNLECGNLPMITFAVFDSSDLSLEGLPDSNPDEPHRTEHAAIITGYNLKTSEFTIAHWGNIYTVDSIELYRSAHAIPETRKQEFYNRNSNYSQLNKDSVCKYFSAVQMNIAADIESIIPSAKSGFRSKLLVVQKTDRALLMERRIKNFARLNITAYGFFQQKPDFQLDTQKTDELPNQAGLSYK